MFVSVLITSDVLCIVLFATCVLSSACTAPAAAFAFVCAPAGVSCPLWGAAAALCEVKASFTVLTALAVAAKLVLVLDVLLLN